MSEPKQAQLPIYIANGELQAQQIQSFLEAAGIKSALRGDSFRKLFDISEGETGAVGIFVAAADEAPAKALLRSAEAGEFRIGEDDDTASESGDKTKRDNPSKGTSTKDED